jgi:hypothetical protein
MRNLAFALLVSVAMPVAALAQPAPTSKNLDFTTISKSAHGGQTAGQKVITDKAAYSALFGGAPPATPTVDFTKEDVLAVAMGQQNTGGYSIEIKRVEYMTGGITGGYAFVHYVETRPAPGSIVTMALTAPLHVVKLNKGPIKYVFVNDTQAANSGSTALTFNRPLTGYTMTITVEDSGKARLLQSSPNAFYMPVDGQATAAELASLNTAVKNAVAATLPSNIPDPRVFIVAPDNIALTFVQGTKTYKMTANYDYYDTYEARVKPVVTALEGIANRLKGVTPPAASFDKLYHAYIGGFVAFQENMTLSKDGAVTVNRTSVFPGGVNKVYTGQASKAELDKVKAAFDAAKVKTLPKTIDDPVLIMDIPAERLVSTIAGTDYTLNVTKAGFYMTYESRVRPLIDALRAIKERVITDTDGSPIYGLVTQGSNGLKIDKYTVPATSPLHRVLRNQVGRLVEAQAHIRAGGVLDLMWVQGVANQSVSVRSYSAWWGFVRATVKKGDVVKILGDSSWANYYRVEANGVTGWAFKPHVTVGNKP